MPVYLNPYLGVRTVLAYLVRTVFDTSEVFENCMQQTFFSIAIVWTDVVRVTFAPNQLVHSMMRCDADDECNTVRVPGT
jgi:ABC-type polysaccharide/polyol phosphate export permease